MKTRDRILEKALDLFNREGLAKISANRIASEMGISPGNLYYHFNNKTLLVEALFRRLEGELAPLVATFASVTALDDVWVTLHAAFGTMEKYRFVYSDIDYRTREYERLGKRIKKTTEGAINAIRRMCGNLANSGVIVADDADLDSLAFHIVFTATCWSTFVKLMPVKKPDEIAAGLAAYHVLSLLSPYLAPEARPYMDYLQGKYLKLGPLRAR